jgi:hypothetical protein
MGWGNDDGPSFPHTIFPHSLSPPPLTASHAKYNATLNFHQLFVNDNLKETEAPKPLSHDKSSEVNSDS